MSRKSSRRNLVIALLCIITVLTFLIPAGGFAATTPANIQGFYMVSLPSKTVDLDGVKYTLPLNYVGLSLSQNDRTITGTLYGFNTTSVTGSKVLCGTTTYNATIKGTVRQKVGWLWKTYRNRQNLVYGVNVVNATGIGSIRVYVKAGCNGTAINGTGVITGSPIALTAGWNTFNVTTIGTFNVSVQMMYIKLGTLNGVVGSSRVILAGTDLITWLDAGTANLTGVSADAGGLSTNITRIVAPGDVFAVTGNGDINITMPVGTSGNVTGTSLTVDGQADEVLVPGVNTITLAGAPGTLTVYIQTNRVYTFVGKYGRVYKGGWWNRTSFLALTGRFEGYILLSTSPWNAAILDRAVTVKKWSYDPTAID
jgi:hypothetical protein